MKYHNKVKNKKKGAISRGFVLFGFTCAGIRATRVGLIATHAGLGATSHMAQIH